MQACGAVHSTRGVHAWPALALFQAGVYYTGFAEVKADYSGNLGQPIALAQAEGMIGKPCACVLL